MTALLQQVFAEAAKLSDAEQDLLALRLRAELSSEDEFDHTLARTSDQLAKMASAALLEHQQGRTEALDPQSL
jgi:hypothetical protein